MFVGRFVWMLLWAHCPPGWVDLKKRSDFDGYRRWYPPIMGPIQIFLLEFEDFAATGGIIGELEALSEAGTIRVLDARFLLKETEDELLAVRATELEDAEREDIRAAAGALIGFGAGLVLGGDDAALAGAILGADAALGAGEVGMSDEDISSIGDALDVGDALLLLVIENVWATGLRDALREAGLVYAEQDYLTPEGLVALGALLGLEAAGEL
jgi:hypothetical protein